MKFDLFNALEKLHPATVTILVYPGDSSAEINSLRTMLAENGFSLMIKAISHIHPFISCGHDTLAAPIYTLSRLLHASDSQVTLLLRDSMSANKSEDKILKGYPALLSSNGIRKSSYHIYRFLSAVHGEIISWGKHYFAVRLDDSVQNSFAVFSYNYNDDILSLCQKDTTLHQARSVLGEFKDEIDLSFNLNLPTGIYTVMKYSLDRSNDLFTHLSSLDFPDAFNSLDTLGDIVPTLPYLEVYQEDVRTGFQINFTMKGVGIQLAIITPKGDPKNDR